MKLPRTIRVGYIDFKVREMPAQVKLEGDCYDHTALIRVKTRRRPGRHAVNTLLHEVVHAIFYTQGLHEVKGLDSDLEEMLVNSFTNGLSQVLRDNPELRKLLRHAR